MALKKFAQTRWTIDPQSITLYPYRIFNVLSTAFAIIFTIFIFVFGATLYNDTREGIIAMIPMFLGLAVIILLLYGVARTYIIFDSQAQVMRKKLFGILTIKSERFDDLENVNIVRNGMGGYNYRAFPKRNKYGKGTVISANYGKDGDPNAIALTQEVFPVIHQYLSQGYQTTSNVKTPITNFKYYNVNPPYYAIKKNTVGSLIFGLCLLAFSIYAFINKSVTENSDTFHKVLLIGATFIGGLGLIFVAFTKIIFDTANQTVSRVNALGIGNRVYYFADFVNFQITRRTTNAIYSGTDINMYFQVPGASKQVPLVLKNIRNTKKIDLFLQETRAIMGIDK